jgi:hypothetical protein
MTETERRFLREIATRVGESRVHELRLFPSLRQGGIESGVAIVAARHIEPEPVPVSEAAAGSDVEMAIPVVQDGAPPFAPVTAEGMTRYEILSARYKLVLKGTERGQWNVDVRHEADAPLETIDRVVRGVALRTGEDGEPQLLHADAFLAAVSDAPFLTDEFTMENGAG